jgi:signal transduction histidine kinase
VPPAPIAVIVLGVVLGVVLGAIGLDRLSGQADASAASRADLLATAIAARVSDMPSAARHDLLDRAARRSDSSLWLVDDKGAVIEDASGGAFPDDLPGQLVHRPKTGEIVSAHGLSRYSIHTVAGPTSLELGGNATPMTLRVIAAVDVPDPPEGRRELVTALISLVTLLTGIAAAVAWAVARDVRVDVEELGLRVREIASRDRAREGRAQDMVPVGSLDEVAELAAAFNGLVERFAAAEKGYADTLARIEEIDRERATFLATVSHELRSPLNAILGFADVLLSEVDGPLEGEAREEVAVIKQSGLHLLALINDILELSALASQQLHLVREPTDLVPIAEKVLREARGARGDKPVELRLATAQPKIWAHVDGRRVRQILTNLVGNALKFTPRGEVVVRLETDTRYAVIRVRDTGPGIPKAERETIFDEYRQGGDARARRRGTGLGLAIARRLTLMHGGSLQVESVVDQGSTFVLKLPLRAPAAPISSLPALAMPDLPGLADETGSSPSVRP